MYEYQSSEDEGQRDYYSDGHYYSDDQYIQRNDSSYSSTAETCTGCIHIRELEEERDQLAHKVVQLSDEMKFKTNKITILQRDKKDLIKQNKRLKESKKNQSQQFDLKFKLISNALAIASKKLIEKQQQLKEALELVNKKNEEAIFYYLKFSQLQKQKLGESQEIFQINHRRSKPLKLGGIFSENRPHLSLIKLKKNSSLRGKETTSTKGYSQSIHNCIESKQTSKTSNDPHFSKVYLQKSSFRHEFPHRETRYFEIIQKQKLCLSSLQKLKRSRTSRVEK